MVCIELCTTIDQTINIDDNIDPVATGAVVTPIVGCVVADAPAAVTTVAALEVLGFTISDNCTADAALVVTSCSDACYRYLSNCDYKNIYDY